MESCHSAAGPTLLLATLGALFKQEGQVFLALSGHFQEGFCGARIVDVFCQTPTSLNSFTHVVKGIVGHDGFNPH